MNILKTVQSDLELPRITTSANHHDLPRCRETQCDTYLKASGVIFRGTFVDIIANGAVFGEAGIAGAFV